MPICNIVMFLVHNSMHIFFCFIISSFGIFTLLLILLAPKEEGRSYIPGSIGVQIRPKDSQELSEIDLSAANKQTNSTGASKTLEDCLRENAKNLPLPKMLSYHEFSEYSNIQEFLYNDIIKKYPYKSMSYFKKMEKYKRKFYKNYIMENDIWPSGVFFKSTEFLHEFLQKHKPTEVKCIRDVYADDKDNTEKDINKAINPIICDKVDATSDINEKGEHISQQLDTETAIDFDTNAIQSTMEKCLIGQLEAVETENRSNVPTEDTSRCADLYSTNLNIGSTKREASETATSFPNPFSIGDIENRLKEQSPECSCTVRAEDIKREIVSDGEREVNPTNQSEGINSYLPEASVDVIKAELEEAVEMQSDQQCCNVIENIGEVVNDSLVSAHQKIIENVGERNDMLELIETPSIPGELLEIKMEPIENSSQNHSTELHKAFEETKDSENILPPKILSYHEFKEYSNIKDYLQNDIIKKYPCKSANYLIKMDKYIRKFYKKYIIGTDSWPDGVFFKSREVFNEFREKHKIMKLKYEADIHADNLGTNSRMNAQCMSKSPIFCVESLDVNNGKGGLIPETIDTKFNTNIREENIEIAHPVSGHESIILNNMKNELNAERIPDIACPPINNNVYNNAERKEDNQSSAENYPSSQVKIESTNDAINGLNIPMVIIPRYEDLSTENITIGATTREAGECGATCSIVGISNYVGSNYRENLIKEEEVKMHADAQSGASQIKEEKSFLHEGENDVASPFQEPELIIFDEPFRSSFLLGHKTLSPRQKIIDTRRLPSVCSESTTNALSFVENNLHEPNESYKEKSSNRNSTKNNEKRSVEKQTETSIYLASEKHRVNSLEKRNETLKSFKKSTPTTHLRNNVVFQKSLNIDRLRPMSKVRVKLRRMSTQNLKKLKRLKQRAIQTPPIHLNNGNISRSGLNTDQLLLMSKVRVRVQRITAQNITAKYPNIKWPGSTMH